MELFVGILAAWGLLMLIWTAAGTLLLPLRRRDHLRLTALIQGKGDWPKLERWLRGVLWLRESGFLWCDIVVFTQELDEDCICCLQGFAERHPQVTLAASRTEWTEEGT